MFRKRKQVQVDTQDEAQVLLLKGQIDGLFKIFEGVIDYLKEDDIEDRHLLRLNDAAVANLNLFGQCCMSKDGKKEILNVAHGHFSKKKEEMDRAHRRIVKPWLEYTECALLGNKLEELQISQITIDAGKRNMKKGDHMTKFLDKLVGAEHKTNNVVNNAKKNRGSLKEQHAKEAQRNKQAYEQRKLMVKSPNQNDMFNIGDGQNIQFASAMPQPSSEYYDQQPKHDDEKQQAASKTDVDQTNFNDVQYQFPNAYVIKAPPQSLYRKNKLVNITYPYPCKVSKFTFADGKLVGVIYAKPNDDLRVKIAVTNLERDPLKVWEQEQNHIKTNASGGLGYDTLNPSLFFQ